MIRALTVVAVLSLTDMARASEPVRVAPWELHNSFWMSLHETLIEDAMRSTPRARLALSAEQLSQWNEAVVAYRTAAGRGDMTFSPPMMITSDAVTQVADDAAEPPADAPVVEALKRAAPLYRKYWWPADERTNQFFITYAAAMLRASGDELIQAHETVYRTKWPERVRAYITPFGGQFGAYTITGRAGGVITTMSSREADYQGLRVIEMFLHEKIGRAHV